MLFAHEISRWTRALRDWWKVRSDRARLADLGHSVEVLMEWYDIKIPEASRITAASMVLACRVDEMGAGELNATYRDVTKSGAPIGDWVVSVRQIREPHEPRAVPPDPPGKFEYRMTAVDRDGNEIPYEKFVHPMCISRPEIDEE